ncbi:MAG: XkdF-like putative serine protease domain-containing protein [Ruminococcus sp.]|nr:XkdF-like putative serine protease domain-containing protein [Ruminococcus sp.]
MNVEKAYEIKDARIKFVSLVDKAANLKKFLITKAESGKAEFTTCGRIVKADSDNHFVTGIVYEPMTEDAHGNYMTEEEITKAAYYFAKNGGSVDLQHSFEPLDGAEVVESWIAKADFSCGNELIQKGTWLMTMEITDSDIWEDIEKGEITGFSMGGMGTYSSEDVQLKGVRKSTETATEHSEKKGVFKKLGEILGFDVVEKGEFQEAFEAEKKSRDFWAAFNTLESTLQKWDCCAEKRVFESDTEKITEALSEFSEAIRQVLTGGESAVREVVRDRPVEKAGRKMSSANKETLRSAYEALGVLLEAVADSDREENEDSNKNSEPDKTDEGEENSKKEEKEVTKREVEEIVEKSVAEAVAKANVSVEKSEEITPESIDAMIQTAIDKALEPKQEAVTVEQVQKMIDDAVTKATEPIRRQTGLPTNLNADKKVEKQSEQHYLYGIL